MKKRKKFLKELKKLLAKHKIKIEDRGCCVQEPLIYLVHNDYEIYFDEDVFHELEKTRKANR